jgi:hypothetical protein
LKSSKPLISLGRRRLGSGPRFALKAKSRLTIPTGGFCKVDLMHKFSWRTMLIFLTCLLLAAMLIGLGTAYISKVKQQRRQLSNASLLTRHPDAETDLHLKA